MAACLQIIPEVSLRVGGDESALILRASKSGRKNMFLIEKVALELKQREYRADGVGEKAEGSAGQKNPGSAPAGTNSR